jgi:hypothetical protein
MVIKMSKNITSLLLPTAGERRAIRKNKDHGLKLFLENRMLGGCCVIRFNRM